MGKVLPAVDKLDSKYVENASPVDDDTQRQEVVVREFDPKFMRKTMRKVCHRCHFSVFNVLTFAAGLDRHAPLDSDLSRLIARQIQPGQCKVVGHDEGPWERSRRRDVRPTQLPLLRELRSLQSVSPL